MEILLRLKHWQVFIPTFGILIVLYVLQVLSDVANFFDLYSLLKVDFVIFSRILALFNVISTVTFVCWAWVLGIKAIEKRPYDDFNENLFKSAMAFELFYTIFVYVIIPFITYGVGEIVAYVGVASFAAGLYVDYVIAKALTSVERDHETRFGNFVGDFFLLLFFPIGVWWIQPRVNRIFDKENVTLDPDAPLDQSVTTES